METILDEYIAAAHVHGEASVKGDNEEANEAYSKLIAIVRQLRQAPDQGAADLNEALKNEDAYVQCWAATHLLPLDETIAVSTLERLATDSASLAGFDATMVLREWRAGSLTID